MNEKDVVNVNLRDAHTLMSINQGRVVEASQAPDDERVYRETTATAAGELVPVAAGGE